MANRQHRITTQEGVAALVKEWPQLNKPAVIADLTQRLATDRQVIVTVDPNGVGYTPTSQ